MPVEPQIPFFAKKLYAVAEILESELPTPWAFDYPRTGSVKPRKISARQCFVGRLHMLDPALTFHKPLLREALLIVFARKSKAWKEEACKLELCERKQESWEREISARISNMLHHVTLALEKPRCPPHWIHYVLPTIEPRRSSKRARTRAPHDNDMRSDFDSDTTLEMNASDENAVPGCGAAAAKSEAKPQTENEESGPVKEPPRIWRRGILEPDW